MQPTDQPADIQLVDRSDVGTAEKSRSGVASSREGVTAFARHRDVSIQDSRFLSGRVHVVAWDVVRQGNSDLSTMLCRGAENDYFLHCRSGDQLDVAASITPLSEVQAAVWFDQHRVHFAPRDARWQ